MDYFKELNKYQNKDMYDRLRKLEDAELELAQLDFDISQSIKNRARQEVIVQQLCELATGHDFENGNNGDETNTCSRCGFETTSYIDHLADMVDDRAKEVHRRGL